MCLTPPPDDDRDADEYEDRLTEIESELPGLADALARIERDGKARVTGTATYAPGSPGCPDPTTKVPAFADVRQPGLSSRPQGGHLAMRISIRR